MMSKEKLLKNAMFLNQLNMLKMIIMPGTDPRGKKAKYCSYRQINPSKCARGSFRTKLIGRSIARTFCCPKGFYDKKREKCRVGTITQTVLKKKLPSGKCPKMKRRR